NLYRIDEVEFAQICERCAVELLVDVPNHERHARALADADREAVDVDAALAEQGADRADDTGAVLIDDDHEPAAPGGLDQKVVELYQARLDPITDVIERAFDVALLAADFGGQRNRRLVVAIARMHDLFHFEAAIGRDDRRVDFVDRYVEELLQHADQ